MPPRRRRGKLADDMLSGIDGSSVALD